MIFPTWLDRFPSKWSLVGASYPCVFLPAANRPVLHIATRGGFLDFCHPCGCSYGHGYQLYLVISRRDEKHSINLWGNNC